MYSDLISLSQFCKVFNLLNMAKAYNGSMGLVRCVESVEKKTLILQALCFISVIQMAHFLHRHVQGLNVVCFFSFFFSCITDTLNSLVGKGCVLKRCLNSQHNIVEHSPQHISRRRRNVALLRPALHHGMEQRSYFPPRI